MMWMTQFIPISPTHSPKRFARWAHTSWQDTRGTKRIWRRKWCNTKVCILGILHAKTVNLSELVIKYSEIITTTYWGGIHNFHMYSKCKNFTLVYWFRVRYWWILSMHYPKVPHRSANNLLVWQCRQVKVTLNPYSLYDTKASHVRSVDYDKTILLLSWVPKIRVRWRHATQPKRLKRLLFVDHPSIHGCRSPSTRNVRNIFHPSICTFIQIIIHPSMHPVTSLAIVECVQVDQKTTSQTHLVSRERSRPSISTTLSASPPSDEECWLASSFDGFDQL